MNPAPAPAPAARLIAAAWRIASFRYDSIGSRTGANAEEKLEYDTALLSQPAFVEACEGLYPALDVVRAAMSAVAVGATKPAVTETEPELCGAAIGLVGKYTCARESGHDGPCKTIEGLVVEKKEQKAPDAAPEPEPGKRAAAQWVHDNIVYFGGDPNTGAANGGGKNEPCRLTHTHGFTCARESGHEDHCKTALVLAAEKKEQKDPDTTPEELCGTDCGGLTCVRESGHEGFCKTADAERIAKNRKDAGGESINELLKEVPLHHVIRASALNAALNAAKPPAPEPEPEPDPAPNLCNYLSFCTRKVGHRGDHISVEELISRVVLQQPRTVAKVAEPKLCGAGIGVVGKFTCTRESGHEGSCKTTGSHPEQLEPMALADVRAAAGKILVDLGEIFRRFGVSS